MDKIKTINGVSYVVYHVTYKANILSPAEGMKINIVVDNKTKTGLLGYIQFEEKGTMKDSPFIVIVPKKNIFQRINLINILTMIPCMYIMAFRIKYQSTNIQVVAKPV